jgi:hypothetical protein
MRRLWLLACALGLCVLVAPGCLSQETKRQWAEAWADLRGDNMEMGSHDSANKKIEP